MSHPRLLDAPSVTRDDVRSATVLYLGVGVPCQTLTLRVDGEREPQVVLWQGQTPPRVGHRVSVQRRTLATGSSYWALEGDK